MTVLDEAAPLRSASALDLGALEEVLAEVLPGEGPVEAAQFPSGFSNLTFLLRRGEREVVLRRAPPGRKAATAHDMLREARLLRALRPVFPRVPEILWVEEDPARLGAPFYVMERLRGVILRQEPPPGLELDPARCEALGHAVVDLQAALHSVDVGAPGLEDLGRPEGYVARQLEGWCARYRRARTDDAPDLEDVMAWLATEGPKDRGRGALVHNDYKLDNLVLDPEDPTRILGVLDWEMATRGDPLLDLGNSLAYWVEAGDPEEMHVFRLMPTHLPGMPSRRQLVERYLAARGSPAEDLTAHYVFGLFRLAGIAQQIYDRHRRGQADDPRFGALIHCVRALGATCRRVMAGAPW